MVPHDCRSGSLAGVGERYSPSGGLSLSVWHSCLRVKGTPRGRRYPRRPALGYTRATIAGRTDRSARTWLPSRAARPGARAAVRAPRLHGRVQRLLGIPRLGDRSPGHARSSSLTEAAPRPPRAAVIAPHELLDSPNGVRGTSRCAPFGPLTRPAGSSRWRRAARVGREPSADAVGGRAPSPDRASGPDHPTSTTPPAGQYLFHL